MIKDINEKSVFLLKYSLLIYVKDKKEVLNERMTELIESVFIKTSKKYYIKLEKISYGSNFVNIIFTCVPTQGTKLSSIVNMFKSASSRHVRNEFPITRYIINGKSFWELGYSLRSMDEMGNIAVANPTNVNLKVKSNTVLRYSLLLHVKDSKIIINDEISELIELVFIKTSKKYNIMLEKFEHGSDFVKITFTQLTYQNIKLSSIVNMFKSASSRHVRNKFPITRYMIDGQSFWELGYSLKTVS